MGISPDIIVLRCDEPIEDENIFRKIANFCNVESDCVIENMTIPVLYEAPLMLEKAHIGDVQSSIWDKHTMEEAEKAGVILL